MRETKYECFPHKEFRPERALQSGNGLANWNSLVRLSFVTLSLSHCSLTFSRSTAGAETTSTSLTWWALAMIAQPGIQRRAQAELDAVVGRARPPTFSDASSLPYIQAIVKETLRWRPSLPLGIPHIMAEDVWYEGVFIPKGTMCIANLWQCHHDPESYGDDAAKFNPERFLDAESRILPGPAETRDEGHSTYGFGRRACVGKHVANDTLFITIATVLWAANLERVRDLNGKEVHLDTETVVDTGMTV